MRGTVDGERLKASSALFTAALVLRFKDKPDILLLKADKLLFLLDLL